MASGTSAGSSGPASNGRCRASSHWPSASPHSITPSQGSSGTQSSVTGFWVTRPTQLVSRVSKNGCCTARGSSTSNAPMGHSHPRRGAARRATSSINAMPCSTPKLIQLRGNISAEPADTSTAQPATAAQRRQKRAQPKPDISATAWPMPAQNKNKLTIAVRWVVHSGSR